MKPATFITFVLLVAIGAAHLLRLVSGAQVNLNAIVIPMWVSGLATVVSLGLAAGMWREHRGSGPAAG
jgi:hypothetical protein